MRFQWLTMVLLGIATGAGCGPVDSPETSSDAPPIGSDIEPESLLNNACNTSADCQLAAVYCDSCSCIALTKGEEVPECAGEEVQCLIDPCLNKEAVCLDGTCIVAE